MIGTLQQVYEDMEFMTSQRMESVLVAASAVQITCHYLLAKLKILGVT